MASLVFLALNDLHLAEDFLLVWLKVTELAIVVLLCWKVVDESYSFGNCGDQDEDYGGDHDCQSDEDLSVLWPMPESELLEDIIAEICDGSLKFGPQSGGWPSKHLQ